MPTPTYLPIANITLPSTAGSVTFSSISQNYRDLVLIVNGTISTGTSSFYLTFNSDGSTLCYNITIEGNGSSSLSTYQGAWGGMWGQYGYTTAFGTSPSMHTINFMDYSTTNKHKTVLMRSSNASNSVAAVAGRWASTAAITSFSIFPTASTFAAGSTFALYGVAA